MAAGVRELAGREVQKGGGREGQACPRVIVGCVYGIMKHGEKEEGEREAETQGRDLPWISPTTPASGVLVCLLVFFR